MVLRTTFKPRTENDMTTDKKVARRKLSLLELASDLGNVSKACRMIGYSRQQFYEIRRNFQTYGADGLLDRLPGVKGPHPNRVPAEIEAGDPRSCSGPPLPRPDAGRSGADASAASRSPPAACAGAGSATVY